jgi:putative two-component system response regulator
MTDSKPVILVADDTPANIDVLLGLLERKYRLKVATNGERALKLAQSPPTPELILLDIMMPKMDGFEVCRRLKQEEDTRDIPVIFISALDDTSDKVAAFGAGGVDYVAKPFHGEEVVARVSTHIELHQLRAALTKRGQELAEQVDQQVEEITSSQFATIFALTRLAESRDDNTGHHLDRVKAFCSILATHARDHDLWNETVDDTFIRNIYHASSLHDIGKVAIPDAILLKPGKLDEREFQIMQTHTQRGADTLEEVRSQYPANGFLHMGIDIARSHHERWDGTGYPDNLKGEQIPLAARIMALADVYDALQSERCYKPAFPHEKCCHIITEKSEGQFDPTLIDAFRVVEDEFRTIRA